MEMLSVEQCIQRIEAGSPVHASVNGGAFEIRIETYTHAVCTAIHAGHRFRAELVPKCALSEAERRYEEDPCTDKLMANQPITVFARDSRFEYDLNRPPDACIHEEAWGKKVWKTPLTPAEKAQSLAKHRAFYRVLAALYRKLESLHPQVVVYDVHSFNYRRPGMAETPLFNIGTEQIDMSRWQAAVARWVELLEQIRLPGFIVRCAINEVYYGRGYQATFVREHFPNTLLLPTEIKKVFVDERTGERIPEVFVPLQQALEEAIRINNRDFVHLANP